MLSGGSIRVSGVVLSLALGGLVSTTRGLAQERMFSGAEAYERFMGRWSRQLAPLFAAFAGVGERETILDVGCGTGALAAVVAQTNPSVSVTGIDPAEAYVAYARARHGGGRVRFEVGDAQRLQFPAATFDRTVALLVLNFIPDRAKALDEMIRVTRPGGLVAGAVWDYGDGMQMLRVFWDEAVATDPSAAPRDERHMALSRPGELGALWRRRGLANVSEQAISMPMRFSAFDDYWLPFLDQQGPAGDYVATLGDDTRERLRLRLRARLLGDGPDGPIGMTARAWVVRGVVP